LVPAWKAFEQHEISYNTGFNHRPTGGKESQSPYDGSWGKGLESIATIRPNDANNGYIVGAQANNEGRLAFNRVVERQGNGWNTAPWQYNAANPYGRYVLDTSAGHTRTNTPYHPQIWLYKGAEIMFNPQHGLLFRNYDSHLQGSIAFGKDFTFTYYQLNKNQQTGKFEAVAIEQFKLSDQIKTGEITKIGEFFHRSLNNLPAGVWDGPVSPFRGTHTQYEGVAYENLSNSQAARPDASRLDFLTTDVYRGDISGAGLNTIESRYFIPDGGIKLEGDRLLATISPNLPASTLRTDGQVLFAPKLMPNAENGTAEIILQGRVWSTTHGNVDEVRFNRGNLSVTDYIVQNGLQFRNVYGLNLSGVRVDKYGQIDISDHLGFLNGVWSDSHHSPSVTINMKPPYSGDTSRDLNIYAATPTKIMEPGEKVTFVSGGLTDTQVVTKKIELSGYSKVDAYTNTFETIAEKSLGEITHTVSGFESREQVMQGVRGNGMDLLRKEVLSNWDANAKSVVLKIDLSGAKHDGFGNWHVPNTLAATIAPSAIEKANQGNGGASIQQNVKGGLIIGYIAPALYIQGHLNTDLRVEGAVHTAINFQSGNYGFIINSVKQGDKEVSVIDFNSRNYAPGTTYQHVPEFNVISYNYQSADGRTGNIVYADKYSGVQISKDTWLGYFSKGYSLYNKVNDQPTQFFGPQAGFARIGEGGRLYGDASSIREYASADNKLTLTSEGFTGTFDRFDIVSRFTTNIKGLNAGTIAQYKDDALAKNTPAPAIDWHYSYATGTGTYTHKYSEGGQQKQYTGDFAIVDLGVTRFADEKHTFQDAPTLGIATINKDQRLIIPEIFSDKPSTGGPQILASSFPPSLDLLRVSPAEHIKTVSDIKRDDKGTLVVGTRDLYRRINEATGVTGVIINFHMDDKGKIILDKADMSTLSLSNQASWYNVAQGSIKDNQIHADSVKIGDKWLLAVSTTIDEKDNQVLRISAGMRPQDSFLQVGKQGFQLSEVYLPNAVKIVFTIDPKIKDTEQLRKAIESSKDLKTSEITKQLFEKILKSDWQKIKGTAIEYVVTSWADYKEWQPKSGTLVVSDTFKDKAQFAATIAASQGIFSPEAKQEILNKLNVGDWETLKRTGIDYTKYGLVAPAQDVIFGDNIRNAHKIGWSIGTVNAQGGVDPYTKDTKSFKGNDFDSTGLSSQVMQKASKMNSQPGSLSGWDKLPFIPDGIKNATSIGTVSREELAKRNVGIRTSTEEGKTIYWGRMEKDGKVSWARLTPAQFSGKYNDGTPYPTHFSAPMDDAGNLQPFKESPKLSLVTPHTYKISDRVG
ncbi:MAG: hypothetical protein PHQ57_06535, partial [Candidatus Omnitrophica bacterium]|nr:hypothetical protein [Candidatus Omnitrophota bacterium]